MFFRGKNVEIYIFDVQVTLELNISPVVWLRTVLPEDANTTLFINHYHMEYQVR